MRQTRMTEAYRALRIGSALLFCGAISLLLLLLGERLPAAGVMIGLALYAGNAFLLVEIGRALLSERRGRVAAIGSAAGRFILLGVVLAGVFVFLGREAGIGACGGLLASQVNLHFPIRRTGVAT
jgi:hypothetical protein